MKTQVIQLKQNDDIISVREKMNWSQAGRILLVWPARGEVLNRKLDLNLVVRHAFILGAQVALVTQDPTADYFAHQLKIPVFSNFRDAQEAEWNKVQSQVFKRQDNNRNNKRVDLYQASRPKSIDWQEHPTTKVVCLIISVLALLALGVFILPSAKITLTPQVESQSMVFDLTIDPSISSVNYVTGSLPGYEEQVIVEGQDEVNATGVISLPDQPALGALRFANYSDHDITIPAGTIVSTGGIDPIRFITTLKNDTTLGPDKAVVIPARAIQPGLSGNLAADELVVIEGILEPDLWVTNPSAANGGTEINVASPTVQDLSSLRRQLMSKLMQEAADELQSALPVGDILITPTITNLETMSESAFPAIGELANRLELSLKLKVHAQALSGRSLSILVNPLMDGSKPPGYLPLVDSLEYTGLSLPTIEKDGAVHLTIRATRRLSANVPSGQVSQMVRGNSISQSLHRLSYSLPLAKEADIKITPSWWPRLPFLAMRIEVVQNGVK